VVTENGFSTGDLPAPPWRIALRGTDLVVGTRAGAHGERSIPLRGTFAEIADAIGVIAEPPVNSYPPATGKQATDSLHIDAMAAQILISALRFGDQACRALAAQHAATDPPVPVLWPEHFDVGITLDAVNYGVSPGDKVIAQPYAYVGPHTRRTGEFWNQPFGAARAMTEFDNAEAVVAFFEEGRGRALDEPAPT
ncbi:MAG: hypothetical protein QOJ62_1157, partial [Actinomycetota bacterium]|nr:hypothetical protein [Actinomycetota bacterium]